MLDKFKLNSEFSRNVLTLMTGTSIAQAIPIAISPILTRIYTPQDFGVFALFIAITAIFGSIVNGRYELAIMLPKKDEDAINIFALGIFLNMLISFTLLIIVIVFHDFILKVLNTQEISIWLYLIPLSVFFVGVFNVLNCFNSRQKNYKDIASATVLKAIILATVQLFIGFVKVGVDGLISGEIVSRLFANTRLVKNIFLKTNLFSKIRRVKILALAKKYSSFPKFSLWAILANILSLHLVSIFISLFYNLTTLGYYALSERVLGAPTSLIGKSIGQVFFQEASEKININLPIKKLFQNTLLKLLLIGIALFGSLFFILEDLFALVFGENWRIAGEYAKVLLVLYFARFVVAPLTVVPIILNLTHIDFYFQVLMLILISFLLSIALLFSMSMENFLYIFSFVYALYYMLYLVYLNTLLGKQIC